MNDDARERLGELHERVAALEERLDAQGDVLGRLAEAEQFRRELESGGGGS